MEIETIILVLVWFAAGGILAIWTYLDMRRRKRMEKAWIVAVFLLSIIGLALYILKVKLERSHPYQYPPPPEYGTPEYKLRGGAPEETVDGASKEARMPSTEPTEEKPPLEQVDGIPRCPHCGAAISSHDWECHKCGAKLKY